jgi:hypothetical protein
MHTLWVGVKPSARFFDTAPPWARVPRNEIRELHHAVVVDRRGHLNVVFEKDQPGSPNRTGPIM